MNERRPAHLRLASVGLVFLGGTAGTLARWVVTVAVPQLGPVPLGTAVVNVVGAFVLGLLLAVLARRGPDDGRRQLLRLTVGTGFCGGFTTYSALSNDTSALVQAGLPGHALGYAGGTLVLGLLASALGAVLGGRGRAAS